MQKIGKILDAGRLSPTAGNLQDCKFILVKDPKKIDAVAQACVEQYWINTAPILIVVCSDPSKIKNNYPNKGDVFSYHDGAAATMSMLLTIQSIGLASCWVGAFEEGMLRTALGIPEGILIHAVLPIGYAAEKPSAPPKLTIEDVTFIESYGNKIKDVAAYFEHYAEHVRKVAKKGKEIVKNLAKKLSK